MKRMIAITAAILCVALTSADAQKPKPRRSTEPCANARTQLELNECYCNQYKKADAEMNQVYQKLISTNTDNKLFIDKLRLAQRAWVSFRDAQLDAIYPVTDDPRAKYGSIYPMCYCMAQTELTVERTKQLQRMLKSEEGDGCGWDVH